MSGKLVAGLWANEDGSTIFSLFWTLVLMVLAGVAVDPVNAWRSKQFLKQTADVSAHAAVVALATGSEPTEIRNVVKRAVDVNLDADRVGEVLADLGSDIELLSYDPRSNTASPSNGGPANAALVRLQRSKEQDNVVPFTFLRVATLFSDSEGMPGWEITVEGVAAWVPTTRCRGSDMLIAGGKFHLSANNTWAGARFLETVRSAISLDQGSAIWTTRRRQHQAQRRPRPRRRAPITLATAGPWLAVRGASPRSAS